MKTIVISDIHGCYTELEALISSLKSNGEYNANADKLVFLGDYIDRGENSRLVIKFIRDLQKDNNNVIALMGNHEDMMLHDYMEVYDRRFFDGKRKLNKGKNYNGFSATINSYIGFYDQLQDDVAWIKNLPLYYEDEHFIYVHAGVDVDKPMEEQDRYTLLWVRNPFILNRKEYYKQVIFGHTPTIMMNGSYKPVYTYANNIGIDTGCVFGGALTALIIEDGKVKKFYQTFDEDSDEVSV